VAPRRQWPQETEVPGRQRFPGDRGSYCRPDRLADHRA